MNNYILKPLMLRNPANTYEGVQRINEYINNLSNLVEKKDIDSRFVNVISLEDDRYISKLFNFKNGNTTFTFIRMYLYLFK